MFRQPRDQHVVAHRGASAHAPEHTVEAYDLALLQGAGMLELDIRATADGELVVLHDPTLLRTTGVARAIAATTLADLERIDPVRRPLTLRAVLDRYGRSTAYLVELKDPEPGWARSAVEELDRRELTDLAVVQSFDHAALRALHREAPRVRLAALVRRPFGLARALDDLVPFASGVSAWHGAVDAKAVRAAHERGLEIRAWTVNAAREIERLLDAGVDGVVTDVPDVAAQLAGAPAPVALAA